MVKIKSKIYLSKVQLQFRDGTMVDLDDNGETEVSDIFWENMGVLGEHIHFTRLDTGEIPVVVSVKEVAVTIKGEIQAGNEEPEPFEITDTGKPDVCNGCHNVICTCPKPEQEPVGIKLGNLPPVPAAPVPDNPVLPMSEKPEEEKPEERKKRRYVKRHGKHKRG